MNPEIAARKLSDWRWNREHTAGSGICPLSNGVVHRIAISETRLTCLASPRCDSDQLAEFFADGAGFSTSNEGSKQEAQPALETVTNVQDPADAKTASVQTSTERLTSDQVLTTPTSLEQWEARLWALLRDLLKDDPAFFQAKKEIIVLKFARNVDIVPYMKPPPGLNKTEIEEQIDHVVDLFLEHEVTPNLPATREEGGALVDYSDRMAVDTFDAYAKMVGDQREYSWQGFIRDGCTAVLSALIGSGKSTFAMNLARAWALGEEFLGRRTRQSKTLVVVSSKEYEAWVETMGFWKLRGLVFIVPSTAAHFAKREETVDWFDYQMRHFGCRTFILDTLFDFFGMPPNTSGDSNRIAMNEQTPLLECARGRNYSGLVTGHSPKSEAQAVSPRDPEESFGGHTAWTAQHRMRMTIRRKSQGVNAFITGRGGFGDDGILKERMLFFDKETRLDSLGGPFADYLGITALPSVMEALEPIGWASRSDLETAIGKGKSWVLAGLKEGMKDRDDRPQVIKKRGEGRATKYALIKEPEQGELLS